MISEKIANICLEKGFKNTSDILNYVRQFDGFVAYDRQTLKTVDNLEENIKEFCRFVDDIDMDIARCVFKYFSTYEFASFAEIVCIYGFTEDKIIRLIKNINLS